MSKFVIERCKRERYIEAWNAMYLNDKKTWNDPMYDGVNPALNKTALKTEIDNFCVVVYDTERKGEKGFEKFEYGVPVGIFSMVVTTSKVIGKQYVVHKDYQGNKLGQAMLIEAEKMLLENGYDKYYIGCSQYSAGLIRKHWGIEPFNSNVEQDLYKFNIDLTRDNFNKLYNSIIVNNPNISVIGKDEVIEISKNETEDIEESKELNNDEIDDIVKEAFEEVSEEIAEVVSETVDKVKEIGGEITKEIEESIKDSKESNNKNKPNIFKNFFKKSKTTRKSKKIKK